MLTRILFIVAIIVIAVAFCFTLPKAEAYSFNEDGYGLNRLVTVPISETDNANMQMLGVGCAHEIKGTTIWHEGYETLVEAEVFDTKCEEVTDFPLLGALQQEGIVINKLVVETANKRLLVDLPAIPDALDAICGISGYLFTGFVPNDADAIDEILVGVYVIARDCSDQVKI